jgi:hypothetical protein
MNLNMNLILKCIDSKLLPYNNEQLKVNGLKLQWQGTPMMNNTNQNGKGYLIGQLLREKKMFKINL